MYVFLLKQSSNQSSLLFVDDVILLACTAADLQYIPCIFSLEYPWNIPPFKKKRLFKLPKYDISRGITEHIHCILVFKICTPTPTFTNLKLCLATDNFKWMKISHICLIRIKHLQMLMFKHTLRSANILRTRI